MSGARRRRRRENENHQGFEVHERRMLGMLQVLREDDEHQACPGGDEPAAAEIAGEQVHGRP